MNQKRKIVRKSRGVYVPIPTPSPRSQKIKKDNKALLDYLNSKRKVVITFLLK
ncbi:hypothetical protein [Gracilibacillus boraciitolerans]|uniref:hypothetical protein n=1 Tax=Gracilibacillus boraciitolerans TaxID=307521 RepID=UPI0004AF76DA|nr:hypothetical protein [Gracilibacillus boraciitolerans]